MKYLHRSIGFFLIFNLLMGCSPSDLRSPEIKKRSFTAGDRQSVISTLNSFLSKGSRPQENSKLGPMLGNGVDVQT